MPGGGKHLELVVGAAHDLTVNQMKADLQKVVNSINSSSNIPKIKIQLDTEYLKSQLSTAVSGYNGGSKNGNTGGGKGGGDTSAKQQLALYNRLFKAQQSLNTITTKTNYDGARGIELEGKAYDAYITQLNRTAQAIKALHVEQYRVENGKLSGGVIDVDQLKLAEQELERLSALRSEPTTTRNEEKALSGIAKGYDTLSTKAIQYYNNVKSTLSRNPDMLKKYQTFLSALSSGDFGKGDTGLAKARKEFASIQYEIEQADLQAESFTQRIRRMFREKAGYMAMAAAVQLLRKTLSSLVNNVKEINYQMAQVEIVTGASSAALKKFGDDAEKAAKRVSTSVTDIMDSAQTYARLGYNLSDSLNLSEITNAYANIADTDISSATDSMTSVLKGFSKQYSAEDATRIADILVDVAQKYAIDAAGIGEAMQAAGAALEAGNNSFEQSVALMAAGNASVQDASKTGNALKTTSMRIRGATAELDDAGEDIDEFCKSSSKMQETIKGLSGVDIMLNPTTFKPTFDIMVEISKVYDSLKDVNQAALLEALAGKKNATVVKSIITNIKDLEGAYQTALNSEGALAKATEIYNNSIEGRSKQMQASFQGLSASILDDGTVARIYTGGTKIIDVLTKIIDKAGALPPILTAIGAGLGILATRQNVGKRKPNMPGYARCNLCA